MGALGSGQSKDIPLKTSQGAPGSSIPDKKYRKPPVVEALCEVFFAESEWTATIFGRFSDKIGQAFKETKELEKVEAEIGISPTGQSAHFQKSGIRTQFIDRQRSLIVQLEKDLLVVNQLRPYPRFREWSPVIRQMMQYYADLAKPRGFRKIGLRYINEIELPPVPLEMRDYFKLYASVPPELGSTHGRFMLRMEMTPLHAGHQLLVSLVSKEIGPQGPSKFMFDLYDIFPCEGPLPWDSIMGTVGDAHENVVLAFENSLTQKTKDLFEEEK